MPNHKENLRKQLADRRRKHRMSSSKPQLKPGRAASMNEKEIEPREAKKPVKINTFVLQVLTAGCLFFSIGLVYKSDLASLRPVQAFVDRSFEEHFQFAAVSEWYERQFGNPLALLPTNTEETEESSEELDSTNYAAPAAGTIRTGFEEDGRGVLLETGAEEEVKAVKGGYVIRVTSDEESEVGNLIELQHPDGTTSIYGMLDDVAVNLYDTISSGETVGTVTADGDDSGSFYFALKQGDSYIDPSEVMSFE
ncbi:M23 family metallopeptidase [Shouchella shacheensis]|uniref:M23 family metallopeptidase n=1 Tax=Shouchella shacheensis TaxID=1649580 RepID=UPI0009E89CCB|nr:M23 family metallopeptidase [Shouchella shacheensis]